MKIAINDASCKIYSENSREMNTYKSLAYGKSIAARKMGVNVGGTCSHLVSIVEQLSRSIVLCVEPDSLEGPDSLEHSAPLL